MINKVQLLSGFPSEKFALINACSLCVIIALLDRFPCVNCITPGFSVCKFHEPMVFWPPAVHNFSQLHACERNDLTFLTKLVVSVQRKLIFQMLCKGKASISLYHFVGRFP